MKQDNTMLAALANEVWQMKYRLLEIEALLAQFKVDQAARIEVVHD